MAMRKARSRPSDDTPMGTKHNAELVRVRRRNVTAWRAIPKCLPSAPSTKEVRPNPNGFRAQSKQRSCEQSSLDAASSRRLREFARFMLDSNGVEFGP